MAKETPTTQWKQYLVQKLVQVWTAIHGEVVGTDSIATARRQWETYLKRIKMKWTRKKWEVD